MKGREEVSVGRVWRATARTVAATTVRGAKLQGPHCSFRSMSEVPAGYFT